jgi:hypothetical protein
MGAGKEEFSTIAERYTEVLRKIRKPQIDCEYRAILQPVQRSIVERLRAAVVVARAARPRRDYFQQYERIGTRYVETESDWKQHSLNS